MNVIGDRNEIDIPTIWRHINDFMEIFIPIYTDINLVHTMTKQSRLG